MNKTLRLHGVAAAVALLIATGASAQNLTITNARILDGTGKVIERGAVVVTDGKIVSVAAGTPAAAGGRTIDAGGKTVMPGLIDAHRHIVTGDAAVARHRPRRSSFRSSSTRASRRVLCAIDPLQAIEARKRIEAGQMKGPRLYVGAFLPVARRPTGPPPNGDPARTDPARGPLPDDARACNPARRHDQGRRGRGEGGLRLSEGRAEHHSERS